MHAAFTQGQKINYINIHLKAGNHLFEILVDRNINI